jgi:hypothetical protein
MMKSIVDETILFHPILCTYIPNMAILSNCQGVLKFLGYFIQGRCGNSYGMNQFHLKFMIKFFFWYNIHGLEWNAFEMGHVNVRHTSWSICFNLGH